MYPKKNLKKYVILKSNFSLNIDLKVSKIPTSLVKIIPHWKKKSFFFISAYHFYDLFVKLAIASLRNKKIKPDKQI